MSAQTILNTLTAHTGLAGLVASRIYRIRIPQNPTYPLILFRVSEEPQNSLSSSNDMNYEAEFELYGASFSELENIKAQLKDALTNATDLKSVCTAVADDDFQDDTGNYSIFLDFSIWL